ncbi:unnamed protein product (macronuclear) [Paramecium tetraurelia]|uniref:Uncharacterized protein n=1 Tax=Paramecium tetraurelia TaxID=5888 RepID=A0D2L6_PARTE|nr:uncharacterized protein GSPATT00012791001 [Paramecium tetraurelia]CAK77283.1 unnamed protein product [Paramecium tetraurelia]|eukprot:XP_001444680.1 hypothetical protein (macronuclear) [Paramecium tetraurelia strain d4-2]
MAKELCVLSKQSSQQCFSSLGNFESIQQVNDSNKWDDIKQSRQDLMKKYHQFKTNEVKQSTLSTYQSQKVIKTQMKVLIPKIDNFDMKLNIKRDTVIKNKDKENITSSQYKQQERPESNSQRIRQESVYDRLYNLRDSENKGTKVVQKNQNPTINYSQKQTKLILGHNILIQKRSSDPSILMPISSLIKKTQKHQLDYQQDQKSTQAQIHHQQNNSQDLFKVNVSRQQACHPEKKEISKQNQSAEVQSNLNSQYIPIKHCYFSLVNADERLQNKKVRSLSNEKHKTKQSCKSSKGNRAHTQGKQEVTNQQKINRLYEYILEGNY